MSLKRAEHEHGYGRRETHIWLEKRIQIIIFLPLSRQVFFIMVHGQNARCAKCLEKSGQERINMDYRHTAPAVW